MRLPTLRSLHRKLKELLSTRPSIGMLHFYLDPTAHKGRVTDGLARTVESTLRGQFGARFREEDVLARGSDGAPEWFVFLVSPPRSKQGVTRRDLQEVERRVARELRASLRESLPDFPRVEMPPLRSGAAVLEYDPSLTVPVQLEEARHDARLHGQVERLLDDQLSGLNHKIRTPLTTIKGVIEILRHDPEAARRFLSPLEREVERIQRLLDQFSLVTRVQSGLFDWVTQEVDFCELVEAVVRGLKPTADEYKVEVELKRPTASAKIQAAVVMLEEAVRGLVDNAIRHGARGKLVKVVARANKTHVTLEIIDRGPGIPKEDLPNIFQPFYVVGQDPDVRSQGGGLGLCLARGVVDVHGGELSCESVPGEGTTVTMRLPKAISPRTERPS
ncbi:MAG: HAMP domain-containing histidine kinase [Armatimonadetes bacterium]|nr:HAMP domain-containing histidine kinase [Armatimonadota bacterium]